MSTHKSESSSNDPERGNAPSISADSQDVVAHQGVKLVEATHKVFGQYSKWFLFLGLGLAAYIYSLDGTTTWAYLVYAASEFKDHGLISTIQVAQAIIIAVGKPVIAKVADVGSRGSAYVFVLIFYVIGYIVIASAQSLSTVAGGIILYAVGYTGLQLLTQIIIADITTLKWRGLVTGLMSMPFIINAFVGSNISADVAVEAGWRWGYGMFAILVPVSLAPLIVTLVWAERKAKRLSLTDETPSEMTFFQKTIDIAERLDIVGLVLIGTSVALILLPLTLRKTAEGGWKNPSIIAMIVVGCVLLPVTVLWDVYYAKHPVIARRFLKNKTVVIVCLIGAFDFVSFYVANTYLYSFVLVVKPWSLVNSTYFSQTQTVSLTVFAIAAGVAMRFLRRAKLVLILGLVIRLVGCGLMIHSRGANASDAEIVWSQLLQGIGGGFAAVTMQVSAQASVPHVDVAIITAVVLLITEIGGAIGGAIAGAVWTDMMPGRLAHHLPFVPQADRDLLYGSITYAALRPRGDPIREGVILAYDDVMKILTILATVFAVIPLLIAFFIPNWYLGDQQNAVENTNLAGERIHNPDVDTPVDSTPAIQSPVDEKRLYH